MADAPQKSFVPIVQVVPAGQTRDVNLGTLVAFNANRIFLQVKSETPKRLTFFDMAIANGLSGLEDIVYGELGDSVKIKVNAVDNGSDVLLRLINEELFQLEVTIQNLSF